MWVKKHMGKGSTMMGVSKNPAETELFSVCKYLSIQIDE